MKCINKNLREYQTLKKLSGLSDSELSHLVERVLDKTGRYPFLDEIKGANSEPEIKRELKLNKDNITSIENVLSATNTDNIEDSVQVLNNKYRDKEIEIISYGDVVKVLIKSRPTIAPKEIGSQKIEDFNNFHYFNSIIDKLLTLYGVNIIPITNSELNDPNWSRIPGILLAKAFIYNGNIYVNTDIATIDSPIHELLHILLGGLKYNNRDAYEKLVSFAFKFKSFNEISLNYPNRTQNDISEEVLVTEFAKYLTEQNSDIQNLPENLRYELFYNMTRTLDSLLMGDASVRCISENLLGTMSLKHIAELVNASNTNNNFQGILNDSMISRILSNKKSELLREGLLREECI